MDTHRDFSARRDAALDTLARAPLGELVLALMAVGLLAFGAFAILEGALRRMRVPTA